MNKAFRSASMLQNAAATRSFFQFNYPHSFMGVNNALNNTPKNDQYPHIQREFKQGEHAPDAHVNQRKFPDWYKPYNANYTSEGYFLLGLGGLALFGYSYTNDIKEQKGRKQRKVFDLGDLTSMKLAKQLHAKARVEAGDPEYTKFLVAKPKAHGHH
ncbi:hypothetical protein FGO68_gene17070 [Halteria grandinella]|uniref:Uncharacterized protein n=1 Tax=Halteria grandinella TaxID=5974 RepID=A0A8J8NDJ3_HALGN|nr:hypothetical protein FGO68_gene17070 [Halteria grandinella]